MEDFSVGDAVEIMIESRWLPHKIIGVGNGEYFFRDDFQAIRIANPKYIRRPVPKPPTLEEAANNAVAAIKIFCGSADTVMTRAGTKFYFDSMLAAAMSLEAALKSLPPPPSSSALEDAARTLSHTLRDELDFSLMRNQKIGVDLLAVDRLLAEAALKSPPAPTADQNGKLLDELVRAVFSFLPGTAFILTGREGVDKSKSILYELQENINKSDAIESAADELAKAVEEYRQSIGTLSLRNTYNKLSAYQAACFAERDNVRFLK